MDELGREQPGRLVSSSIVWLQWQLQTMDMSLTSGHSAAGSDLSFQLAEVK